MIAGADSIADLDLLRHAGMDRLFSGIYAPSTLGSFLRSFAFGHVRQLDALAAQVVTGLTGQAPILAGVDRVAYLDIDDTVRATCATPHKAQAIAIPASKASTPCWPPSLPRSRHR